MKLNELTNNLRFILIKMSHKTKSPHLASSLSCVDIVGTLYQSVLKINKKILNYLQEIGSF